ncbi:MAG TPA: sugar ABC transporter permease [Terriglobales bacterium]|nr:sugar ABC transporter permease [Terriglobales bacterium]
MAVTPKIPPKATGAQSPSGYESSAVKVPWHRTPENRASLLGVAMFTPAVLFIAVLIFVPFVMAFVYAFTDVKVGSIESHYVGLENFRSIIQSPSFRKALGNSFIFTIISQVLVIVGSTILSVALKDKFHGRGFMRFLILLPWVAPISLGAIGWKWILDSLYSVINWVLVALHFYKPYSAPMWLGEPHLAMASVILVHTWRLLPFSTVIMLAGLTAIPKDIPEAAEVDGAGFWRTLFQITIPMMLPIIMVAVLFGIIFTFTDMTVVYVLTAGGPYDSTQVLPSLAFFTGILAGDLSQGAAISLFLVPIMVVVTYVMLRLAYRSEVA